MPSLALLSVSHRNDCVADRYGEIIVAPFEFALTETGFVVLCRAGWAFDAARPGRPDRRGLSGRPECCCPRIRFSHNGAVGHFIGPTLTPASVETFSPADLIVSEGFWRDLGIPE
jgi:hypothetical protein